MRQKRGAFDPEVLAVVKEFKAYRLVMGLTQKEVAARMGVGFMSISHWEALDRMPDMIHLRLWATALGYTLKVSIE